MVEGAPLLREYAGNRIEGSNPSLSAISLSKTLKFFVFKVGLSINPSFWPWQAQSFHNLSKLCSCRTISAAT